MIVWTNGWLWIIAALLLALIEMILPGYVFLGLAAAVGVMGVVLLAGLWGWGLPAALVVTAVLFIVLSLPGVLWRLYALRQWVASRPQEAAREYRDGVLAAEVEKAITGSDGKSA